MKLLFNEIKRKINYNSLKNNAKLPEIIADYLQAPLPTKKQFFQNTSFLVLDFETTGLNPKTDKILSIGFTVIEAGKIRLGKSSHFYTQCFDKIADESVKIHQITEQKAALGTLIEHIIPILIAALSGRVLVAHYADIEVKFLQKIVKDLYGVTLPLMVVDTLQIAYKEKYRNSIMIEQNALNLFRLREQYNLPRYKAHNALSDAIATAELLLVQVANKNNAKDVLLNSLL